MLTLGVDQFEGPDRWRWVLTGPGGEFLADHEVRLDRACWQFEAFADTYRYLRVHAAPDRRTASEAEIVAKLGRWIGAEVLGGVGDALLARAPLTVRVVIPDHARVLGFRPLELAVVRDKVLTLAQVGLVMQVETATPTLARAKASISDHVRILGLFSLPEGISVLNLRRERHGLARLVEDVAKTQDRSILLRVLQYGVTRDRLRDVIEEAEGWDVIHISAHGLEGGLLLEDENGAPDLVTGRELVDLLAASAGRVRLVTLSSCSSAALTIAEHRRLLGLAPVSAPSTETSLEDGDEGPAVPALAAELAQRLDVAVIGMRFPVIDEFALRLSAELYRLLLGKRQPVARALSLALTRVVTEPATLSCPALSAGTPALFGARAVDTTLVAPRGGPVLFDERRTRKMAQFPEQPERFVGRTGVLTRVGQVLAPGSGRSGVLLHGLAGVGKTASALELAYTHHNSFRAMVWYRAPAEGTHTAGTLADFAFQLETALPDLKLVHRLDDAPELERFLPVLTEFCRIERVLFVLDNLESLLTENGTWRDPRWESMIAALTEHRGLSRLILTSQRRITRLGRQVVSLPVHPLTPDETLLLARELPHLLALIEGEVPGLAIEEGRQLVIHVLRVAQGHPTLLELADSQAADPARLVRLRARLTEADEAWAETTTRLEEFFNTGQTGADADDYLLVLGRWTRGVVSALPEDAASLFTLLCLLEDDDRLEPVVAGIWREVFTLVRETMAPDLNPALAVLAANGLIRIGPFPDGDINLYQVHPAVAAAGSALADADFRASVDRAAANVWLSSTLTAAEHEYDENPDWLVRTGLLLRQAIRGAATYLLRLGSWQTAVGLLKNLVARDHSPETARALLPVVRAIADRAHGATNEWTAQDLLFSVLLVVDPPAAEHLAQEALTVARRRQDMAAIHTMSYNLQLCYRQSGRLAEALVLMEELFEQGRGGEFGPWTQLQFRTERLVIRVEQHGETHAVEEMQRIRRDMDELTDSNNDRERFPPGQVRENVLQASSIVALRAERWQEALDFNTALSELEMRRNAPADWMAITRFTAYGPLLKLGRIEDARTLLVECRDVFERVHNVRYLAKTLSALGHVEEERGHGDVAVGLTQDALRYHYLTGDLTIIASTHHDLGALLGRQANDYRGGFVHTLAYIFLRHLAGQGIDTNSVALIVVGLRVLPAPPATLLAMHEELGRFDGIQFGTLLSSYWPDPDDLDQAYDHVLDTILAAAVRHDLDLAQFAASWDMVISGIIAATDGNSHANEMVDYDLSRAEGSPSWAALARILRRIRAGERDRSLITGDRFDIAITRRTLAALADRSLIPPQLWPIMPQRELLGQLVRTVLEGERDKAKQIADSLVSITERDGISGLSLPLYAAAAGDLQTTSAGNSDPIAEALTIIFRHYLDDTAEQSRAGDIGGFPRSKGSS